MKHDHTTEGSPGTNRIGTLAEKSLHASLKQWLALPGDRLEVPVDGYVVDIVRGETLIEVQTRHLYALKAKLRALLPGHPFHVYCPLPQRKWIVRRNAMGEELSRRKSPRRGTPLDIFAEVVRLPRLITHPNLCLTALLTEEEEVWRDDGQGSWRRKGWSVADRRLLAVTGEVSFASGADWQALVPASLEQPFTTRQLATALGCRLSLAQKIAYTLRHAGLLQVAGRSGNGYLYAWPVGPPHQAPDLASP